MATNDNKVTLTPIITEDKNLIPFENGQFIVDVIESQIYLDIADERFNISGKVELERATKKIFGLVKLGNDVETDSSGALNLAQSFKDNLNASISTVSQQVQTLRSDVSGIVQTNLTEINQTMEELSGAVGTAVETVSSYDSAISSIRSLETTLQSQYSSTNQNVSTVDGRVDNLASSFSTMSQDFTTISNSLDEKANASDVNSQIQTLTTKTGEIDTLAERVTATETAIQGKASTQSLSTVSDSVSGLNTRLTAIEGAYVNSTDLHTAVVNEITATVQDSNASLDTLRTMSTWLTENPNSAAAMQDQITAISGRVTTIENGYVNNQYYKAGTGISIAGDGTISLALDDAEELEL